jgi:flavin-dependent dehydrogenase
MRDAIADPDGHGWQIDRAKFEQQLRAEAVRRGTVWEAPAKVVGVDFDGRRWAICCAKHGRDLSVSARILVDAAGRGSRCVAPKMTRKVIHDALCSTWLLARDVQLPGGTVQIEAEAGGWWYAAPLPNGLAVLAFHTDSDLPEARAVRAPGLLLERARALPLLGEVVAENAWSRAQFGYCAAHGAWLDRAAGDAWFAIGDAAISFDPLAGQGLFNAMYLGLSAAESADRLLSGEPEARIRYAAEVARVRDTYVARRAAWYQIEKRWASRPFWARRAAIADAHAAAQQTPQSPIGDGGEQRRERR